jgi:HPt (histidine-containing phosphotransfer) domain-containing protein
MARVSPASPLAQSSAKLVQHPIDMQHLSRQTLGDSGLQAEVLRLFADAMRVYYGRLERSTTRNDLMVNFHALRGAAAGVGAFGLSKLAQVAEDELRQGAPVDPERVHDVGLAVGELQAFIVPLMADDA